MKKLSFVVKLQRPVCRTPIKPLQKHKTDVEYTRKVKHKKELRNERFD
jgi:hypothetical protein